MFQNSGFKKTCFLFGLFLIMILLNACAPSAARLNRQGNEAFEKEEYNSALDPYQQAQEKSESKAVPEYNLGNTYYRLGQFDQAISALQSSLTDADESLAMNSNFNLGNTLYDQGKYEAAIEAYKETLRLNPDDVDAKYNLELAQQQLEQQKQQQQQSAQSSEEQNKDGTQQEQQGQQEQNQDNQSEQQEQQESPEQEQPQTGELSEEEAKQLLDAASEDTQSLQEYLQQIYVAPGEYPEKDW